MLSEPQPHGLETALRRLTLEQRRQTRLLGLLAGMLAGTWLVLLVWFALR
jgi:hypothetical protein